MNSPPPDSEPAPCPSVVLALDPGSHKCGLAVVRRGDGEGKPVVLHREVSERSNAVARTLALVRAHGVETLLVGNATGGAPLARALAEALGASLPVRRVDEAFTSERARRRFLDENPPRGLLRLVPRGLRSPSRPYDDYAATVLAEDFFATAPSPTTG